MSKAADLARTASASETALSNRNVVINGDYTISQRGTSFTQADTYSLDRWRLNQSGETMSVSQQGFTAGQTDVPRAKHYLRVIITTTGNNAGITQRVEGVNNLSGQSVTLSFYARGGQGGQAVPTTFRTYLNQNFGSGGSTAVNVQGSTNHGLTSSWQFFTATVTLGSTSGKTVGTSPFTEIVFQQTTAEACDFDIALVQLEVGTVATPFEHRSYGQELALCERYCTVYKTNGEGQIPHSSAQVDSANRPEILLLYPKKRANPSIAVVNSTNFRVLTAANTAIACSGYGGTYLGTGPDSAIMFWNVSSGVSVNALSGVIQQLLIFQNTGSITIDAEL